MITALLALTTGLAYVALGAIAVHELVRHRSDRGFSHFGLALALMAFTCGPHHLGHAYRHFAGGEPAHGPMLAALALGVVPALIFVGLRVEAARGGRGDRLIVESRALSALPWLMVAVGGATIFEALRHAAAGIDPRALVPNVILACSYALVGYYTARAQVARHPVLGGWSLSGVAMSAVFLTCGVSHLVAGLVSTGTIGSVALDNLAVPASLYFLWAVRRLHRDSHRDWNRRPLVGRAAPLGRRSPWAEPGA